MSTTLLTRRSAAVAATLLSVSLVLTACGSDDDSASPGDAASASPSANATSRIIAATNGTITVPANPQRVVTIGNTTVPFLDLGGKPAGVTEVSDTDLAALPAAQKTVYDGAEVIGTNGGEVDLEKLADLRPDLILVQFHSSDWDSVGKQLETVAPTVYWGLDTEWKELADAIATSAGTTESLGKQKSEFDTKLAAIKSKHVALLGSTSFVDVSRGDWSDPGTFYIADIGCSEIARDDLGLNLPKAAEGADPLAYDSLPFERLSDLSKYDVVTYPVDSAGQPTEPFAQVMATSTWKALPAVTSGKALGVFCPNNNSYGPVLQYLDSLDKALATLSAKG